MIRAAVLTLCVIVLALAAMVLAARCAPPPTTAAAPSSPAGTTAPVAAEAADWWRHVVFLADDDMRGRETGSPEHRKAAEYAAGITPSGQPVIAVNYAYELDPMKVSQTQAYIEALLNQYQGTLLVVSHDEAFLAQLGLTHWLVAGEKGWELLHHRNSV